MAVSMLCECGEVQGTVQEGQAYARASCYCRDCQAYAAYLKRPMILDAQGGTDIVAMNPAGVSIDTGHQHIACVSLSAKGLLRWYASCCSTPLGNTPRDGHMAYVGMVGACLVPAGEVDRAFGPAGQVVLNAASASGEVKSTPVAFLFDGLRIFRNILAAKLRKQPPALFFNINGNPIREAEILDGPQRAALGANPV